MRTFTYVLPRDTSEALLTMLGAGALAQPRLLRLTDVGLAGFAHVVTAGWIFYGTAVIDVELVDHPRFQRLPDTRREAYSGARNIGLGGA